VTAQSPVSFVIETREIPEGRSGLSNLWVGRFFPKTEDRVVGEFIIRFPDFIQNFTSLLEL
jgi:hypothetical protein